MVKKSLYLLLLISMLSLISCSKFPASESPIYTENINDYNSVKHNMSSAFFISQIPKNAEIVAFSYYNYFNEDEDIYLELKFQTEEEFDLYLEQLIFGIEQRLSEDKHRPLKNGKWFVEQRNIWNSNYIDLFSVAKDTYYQSYFWSKYQTYYSGEVILGHYAILSYSQEEKTVIQTICRGVFTQNNSYVPQYLKRFKVPVGEDIRHEVVFDYMAKVS